jgi:hypothetical protein
MRNPNEIGASDIAAPDNRAADGILAHEVEAWLQSLREARDIGSSNGDDNVWQRV